MEQAVPIDTGSIQICQKILASYSLYFALVWLFSSYQVDEIQKNIRIFLWSNGKGKKKKHATKWEWCCLSKVEGELGLKDLKI